MHRLALLIVTGTVLLGGAQGVSASHTGLLYGAPTRIVVTMEEYRFTPSRITVQAGTAVDIVLENKGTQSHVFMVYPKPQKKLSGVGEWWDYVLKATYFQDMGEILIHSRYEFEVAGTRVSEVGVEPGKKVTLTFTPTKKGTFEIGCHLPTGGANHYDAGMKGAFVVK